MLKFQNNYTTLTGNFEDFILLVYVTVDDLYKKVVSDSVSKRRNYQPARLSDSQVITIAVCGELIGIDSQKAWYSFVKKIYVISFQICVVVLVSIASEEIYFRLRNYSESNYLYLFPFPKANIM